MGSPALLRGDEVPWSPKGPYHFPTASSLPSSLKEDPPGAIIQRRFLIMDNLFYPPGDILHR